MENGNVVQFPGNKPPPMWERVEILVGELREAFLRAHMAAESSDEQVHLTFAVIEFAVDAAVGAEMPKAFFNKCVKENWRTATQIVNRNGTPAA